MRAVEAGGRAAHPSVRRSPGENAMTKERQTHRETRKRPTMTLKEKRSAKKAKEAAKTVQGGGKPT
jgi:hypothetical protein